KQRYARLWMSSAGVLAPTGIRHRLLSPRNWFIVGVFALLAGGAFATTLAAFLDQSREALSTPPPEPINVNQLLIRPFLLQVGAAALLVLPLVTAHAFNA